MGKVNGEMETYKIMKKTHKLCVSQNGWEYGGCVLIKSESIEFKWAENHTYGPDCKERGGDFEEAVGTAVMADGVEITFDEPFIYDGCE